MGIAVALLGRSNPLGIIFSALLFAALQKGAADLDLETDRVSRDLAMILESLVILAVGADAIWDGMIGKVKDFRQKRLARLGRVKPSEGASS
jgi:simple sugar transport system permease protein